MKAPLGMSLAMAAAAMLGTGRSPYADDDWYSYRSQSRAPKPKPKPMGPTAKRAKVKAARKANVKRKK